MFLFSLYNILISHNAQFRAKYISELEKDQELCNHLEKLRKKRDSLLHCHPEFNKQYSKDIYKEMDQIWKERSKLFRTERYMQFVDVCLYAVSIIIIIIYGKEHPYSVIILPILVIYLFILIMKVGSNHVSGFHESNKIEG